MGRAEFWNDIIPAALLSIAVFLSLVGVILINVHWTSWAYSNSALLLYGLCLFVSNIISMLFLGIRVKDDRFIDSIKLGATVSAILIISTVLIGSLLIGNILPLLILAQALSQIFTFPPSQTQPQIPQIPPSIIQTLGAYLLGIISLSMLGAFIGALLSLLLDKFQFEFKIRPVKQEEPPTEPDKPKRVHRRRKTSKRPSEAKES